MSNINAKEIYPHYVTFQQRMQEFSVRNVQTEFARKHYDKVFSPKPFEHFEVDLFRMSAQEANSEITKWKAGFDMWLQAQKTEHDERWGQLEEELEEAVTVLKKLGWKMRGQMVMGQGNSEELGRAKEALLEKTAWKEHVETDEGDFGTQYDPHTGVPTMLKVYNPEMVHFLVRVGIDIEPDTSRTLEQL